MLDALPPDPEPRPPPRRRALTRYLPITALVVVALTAWWAGLPQALTPAELGRHATQLRSYAADAPVLALGAFILTYAVLTGACLPVALMLSLLGGLVFGRWLGGVGVLLGATGGALVTYAATKSAFSQLLLARAERDPRLRQIMLGFGRNAFAYVLTLRLLPFFPFPLVNLASGLAAVPVRSFAAATVLGGVPTAGIYASLGAGLGETLTSEHSLLQAARAPGVILPLIALAALSISPALYRHFRRRAKP